METNEIDGLERVKSDFSLSFFTKKPLHWREVLNTGSLFKTPESENLGFCTLGALIICGVRKGGDSS